MKNAKVKRIARIVVRIILGILIILAGAGKFFVEDIWVQKFQEWGYPKGFHYLTGILEILAGILIFIPRFWLRGTYFLLAIMVAAFGTHVVHGEFSELLSPGIYLVLIGTLLALRKN